MTQTTHPTTTHLTTPTLTTTTSARPGDLRCRCGCLLAKVSVPVRVSYDGGRGIEIRCRRCKSHVVLLASTDLGDASHDDARDDASHDDAHDVWRAAE